MTEMFRSVLIFQAIKNKSKKYTVFKRNVIWHTKKLLGTFCASQKMDNSVFFFLDFFFYLLFLFKKTFSLLSSFWLLITTIQCNLFLLMLRYIFKKSDQIYIRKTLNLTHCFYFITSYYFVKMYIFLIICILWLFQIYFLTENSPVEHMQYFLGPLGGCRLHFGTLHQIKWHQTN